MDHTLFQFTGVKTHLGFWRSKEKIGILHQQTDIVQAINTA